jgi:ABC-2 type transport system permease protein
VAEAEVAWAPLLFGQVRYANRGFWRTPVSAFFTIVFPLSFLVILSALYGNELIDQESGLRLAQYTTPVFAVFGVCMACMVSLAIAVAYARAYGVLKRLRGTPLPPSIHIAGRVGSALWVSMIATVVMVGVGVVLYGVQIIWENMPALLLTFLVGIACFCAIGLAIAALAPTPSAAQAIGNGSLILLSFISGIFGFADLPSWMERIALVFPLKHFVDPAAAAFNPYVDASTPSWDDLAVMAVWGLAAALVVRRAFRWDPTPGRPAPTRGRRRGPAVDVVEPEEGAAAPWAPQAAADVAGEPAAPGPDLPAGPMAVTEAGPPGPWPLVAGQARYAALQVLRDPTSLFFAIAFPVLLVTFFSLIYGSEAQWGGLPLPQYLAAAFAVYGVATTAFVNLPGSIADQRAQWVLKRLRGTPMPPISYLAGRILAALVLGLATVVLVFVVAVAFLTVSLPPSTWAATTLTFTVAIICFAACGLALVALVDSSQAVIAVSLCLLLPLSFISDIFISVGQMPTVLNAIGWTFPLRHAVHAAVTATSGGALDSVFWNNLGVLVLWTGIGLLVAWRFFHWEPRQAKGRS